MTKLEQAQQLRRGGMSCSQAVFLPYAREAGMPDALALSLALPFAGGMFRADLCGALTGAYLVAGLLKGAGSADPKENRVAVQQAVSALTERFAQDCGPLRCRDLLGCDPATPEGMQRMREHDLKEAVCMKAIVACMQTLAGLEQPA